MSFSLAVLMVLSLLIAAFVLWRSQRRPAPDSRWRAQVVAKSGFAAEARSPFFPQVPARKPAPRNVAAREVLIDGTDVLQWQEAGSALAALKTDGAGLTGRAILRP